jgi:hypothetical protein
VSPKMAFPSIDWIRNTHAGLPSEKVPELVGNINSLTGAIMVAPSLPPNPKFMVPELWESPQGTIGPIRVYESDSLRS